MLDIDFDFFCCQIWSLESACIANSLADASFQNFAFNEKSASKLMKFETNANFV